MPAGMNDRQHPASRQAPAAHRLLLLIAFTAGALTVLGFAPFHLSFVPFATLALLFWQWSVADSPKQAFRIGWVFGLGFFLAGVSWIYVSLHTFGAMPLPLAAAATLLFCAFLALFPAAAGYVVARSRRSIAVKLMLVAPACWVLAEWVRSWIFTGFPWNTVGYSQIVGSPLAGYAPVAGIYAVSLAVAVTAGCLTLLVLRWREAQPPQRARALVRSPAGFVLGGLLLCGFALKSVEWTEPSGTSTTVSLLQGNVPQDMKWREEAMLATLKSYADLTLNSRAQLIVLPETALPLFLHQVPPDYLDLLGTHAKRTRATCFSAWSIANRAVATTTPRPRSAVRRCNSTASRIWCRLASSFRCGRCWHGSSISWPFRCRIFRADPSTSNR